MSAERIQAAVMRANDMVIGASFGIMEADTDAQRAQASYFRSLFTSIRNVLQEAQGQPSPAVLALADAVLDEGTAEPRS